jgi:hypothetical protein
MFFTAPILYGRRFKRFVALWAEDFDTPLQLQHCYVVAVCSTEPVAQNCYRGMFVYKTLGDVFPRLALFSSNYSEYSLFNRKHFPHAMTTCSGKTTGRPS